MSRKRTNRKEPLSLRFTRVFYPLAFPLLGLGIWIAALQSLVEGFQAHGAATRRESLLSALIFAALGAVFLSVGGVIYKGMKEPEKKRRWLKENGRQVMACVVEIHPVHSMYGESPYEVICEVEQGVGVQQYTSHYTWVLPLVQPGDRIPVYLDPSDATSYFVDFEAADHVAVER